MYREMIFWGDTAADIMNKTVVEMNKSDKGTRQCIVVTNNENNICEEVTYVRASRAINGFSEKNQTIIKPQN